MKSSRFLVSTLLLFAPAFSRAQNYPSMKQDVALFKLSDAAMPEVIIFREADCIKRPKTENGNGSNDSNLETIQVNDITGKPLLVIERNQTTAEGRYEIVESTDRPPMWHPFEESEIIRTTEENGLLVSGIREFLEERGNKFRIVSPDQIQALKSAALTTVPLGQVRASGDPLGVIATIKPADDQDDWVPIDQQKPQQVEKLVKLNLKSPIRYFHIDPRSTSSLTAATTAPNKSAQR